MKHKFKISFGLLVTIIVFMSVIFATNKNDNDISVVKNTIMPFMGNNSVSYGGLQFTSVSDITGTTEADNVKNQHDRLIADDEYGNNQSDEDSEFDFLTTLKIVVNINANTPKVESLDFYNIDNDGEYYGGFYEMYYDYYSPEKGNVYGTEDTEEELYKSFTANSTITMYIFPKRDIPVGNSRFAFSFETEDVTNAEAYTDFALYRFVYVNSSTGKDYVRIVDSHMNSFMLDEVSDIVNSNFRGWANSETVGNNSVAYTNQQTMSSSQLMNVFNNKYEEYLLGLYYEDQPQQYTVQYNKGDKSARLMSGVSAIANKDYYLTDTITIPENVFERDYYEFNNWTLNSSDDSAILEPGSRVRILDIIGYVNLSNIINIYAKWEPIEYTLTYDANGALGELSEETFTVNNTFITMKFVSNDPEMIEEDDLYRDGYEFVGFSKNKNAKEGDSGVYESGERVPISELGIGDVTLYAIWKVDDLGGGGNNPPDNPPDNPPVNPDDPVSHIDTYDVIFDSNGGSGTMNNSTINSNALFTIPTCSFTKDGFTFDGWLNGSKTFRPGDNVGVSELNIVNNKVTFVASWKSNETSFVLSFDPNGGNGTIGNINYIVGGSPITVPENSYSRTGYKFVGWATSKTGDPDSNYAVGKSIELTKNVKLYAVWTPITYYIVYHSNATELEDGTSNITGNMENTVAKYDQNVSLRKNAFVHSNDNYAFAGWATTPTGKVDYLDQVQVSNLTNIEEDEIDLYAIWVEKKHFTISFNNTSGNGSMETVDGETYTNIQLPPNTLKRDGYDFSGWATEENGKVVYKDKEVINLRDISSDNLVLYAVWTPKSSGGKTNKTSTKNTIITNPTTSRTSLVILLVIASCIGARYIYSKRRSY